MTLLPRLAKALSQLSSGERDVLLLVALGQLSDPKGARISAEWTDTLPR